MQKTTSGSTRLRCCGGRGGGGSSSSMLALDSPYFPGNQYHSLHLLQQHIEWKISGNAPAAHTIIAFSSVQSCKPPHATSPASEENAAAAGGQRYFSFGAVVAGKVTFQAPAVRATECCALMLGPIHHVQPDVCCLHASVIRTMLPRRSGSNLFGVLIDAFTKAASACCHLFARAFTWMRQRT
jgi:hypothetical protein